LYSHKGKGEILMEPEAKKVSHIPKGFTAVTPYFQVTEGAAFIAFVKEAFDAEEVDVHKEDGVIRHYALKIFGAMIEGSEVQADSGFPSRELAIHLYVPDADATYAKAIAAGAKSIHEVQDMPYGERSGGVVDPCGNHWYIATQTTDMYPES